MRYLNNVLVVFKKFSNIILESVILLVLSVGACKGKKSKCCIALPTDAEDVRLFEKTLSGGFSCVNTGLAFDTEILLDDGRN